MWPGSFELVPICLERVPAYPMAVGEAAEGRAGHLEELDNEEDQAEDGVHLGDLDLPEAEVHREVLRRNNQLVLVSFANQRPVPVKTRNMSRQIRGQYSGHMFI